jgi:uncharacterized membrane-anchored protein YhcB (DUF1043 family)
MTHIGILKPDTYIRILNFVGLPLVGLYVVSMFIVPWFSGSKGWDYVHGVWYDWQSLNVAMLAFLSSIVAFNIGRYNAEKQRERDFTAAKAFLPESLSELVSYFKSSARLLEEAWEKRDSTQNHQREPLTSPVPDLPTQYKEVFARAIERADPDVGKYLAYILMRLQIHHARIKELYEAFGPDGNLIIIPANIMSYLYSLAELLALVNRLYGFARNMEPFNGHALSWDDFGNAYANLDIYPEEYDDLVGFTKRAIARHATAERT